jgi:hypothetical protein
MYHVLCQVSGTSGFTEDPNSPYGALACPPGSGCCEVDHDCGEAASTCSGGHGACPTPNNCKVWLSMQPHLENSNQRDTSAGPCPGGHCGLGVDGCAVCHPLTITVIPGSVTLQQVGA